MRVIMKYRTKPKQSMTRTLMKYVYEYVYEEYWKLQHFYLHITVWVLCSQFSFSHLSWGTTFPTRLHARPAKTQISLRVSDQSLRCLPGRFESFATHRVACEDSDQTARDAHADLRFRWAHMACCIKCCAWLIFDLSTLQKSPRSQNKVTFVKTLTKRRNE